MRRSMISVALSKPAYTRASYGLSPPFTTASLARSPLLFIGTFTPVDREGKNAGPREWHRVCLALVDLRSGVIVSKGFARARMEGVDLTPTAYYLDSPAWAPDPVVQGYVGTWVAGQCVQREGEITAARPGHLVRLGH